MNLSGSIHSFRCIVWLYWCVIVLVLLVLSKFKKKQQITITISFYDVFVSTSTLYNLP